METAHQNKQHKDVETTSETFNQYQRIVVVSALATSIVQEYPELDLHMKRIKSEAELIVILNSNKVISYMSHQSANDYLKSLDPEIEISKERDYSYRLGDALLFMGLPKRPERGADLKVNKFEDYVFYLATVKA